MTSMHITADGTASASGRVDGAAGALASWITSTDHKRVGRLYIGVSLLVGVGVLVVAVLLGLERVDAGSFTILREASIGQLFALLRYGLVFGVVGPLLIGVLLAVVPLQIGARAVAFPRAAALSFWLWFGGIDVMIGGFASNGGPGAAGTKGMELFLVGLGLVALALCVASVCLVTTVWTQRTAGLTLVRLPALSWSALVTGSALLLTLPVLLARLIAVYVDYRYGQTAFGGATGVGGAIGSAISQPATYCFVIPVLALLGDVAPLAGRVRRKLGGAQFAGIALIALGAFGGLAQRFTATDFKGDSGRAAGSLLFHLLTSALPIIGVLLVLGTAVLTVRSRPEGKPTLSAGFVYGLGATLVLFLGVLFGILTGFSRLDLGGTAFIGGQFELVMLAGLLGGMGAVAHWGPKLWGQRLPDRPAAALAVVGLLSAILIGGSDLVLGFYSQPDLAAAFRTHGAMQAFNVVGTVGWGLLLIVVVAFAGLVLRGFSRGGAVAGDDPYDGQTLEWATSSPAPTANFVGSIAAVGSSEPLLDMKHASGKDA